MTVHIFVSLLSLALLMWTLWCLTTSNHGQTPAPWFLTWAVLLLLLPVSFPPFVPLSHYIFEATSDNVLWFVIVFGLLWILCGVLVWKYKPKALNSVHFLAYAALWAILGFWGYLGATISAYERGPAPNLTDAAIYMIHWGTVHLAILCLFFLLFFRARYYRSNKEVIFACLLFLIYVAIPFSS